ncbi:MAG: PQQ-binding-like beta-propeller repeat protein [Gemmatimonadetes bacterium]|nr:PQQ-binding-like beta-propeller repeat protein [Gemmatimonadota bacterium]MYF74344.1 PQQ-binding-like beta-propeller repeat protein [Gemmatimonadota bacterium]MYK53097.1 PQQ-binding-like beta-propeller repeat protein [Gemmatimonadota bacterium]
MTIEVRGRVMDGPSGRGLGGVLVSNGEQIVQTDGDGRYALVVESEAHRFVFVTVPDGFRATSGFYSSIRNWIDAQDGVDFWLESAPERAARQFKLVQITDTHVVTEGEMLTSGEVLAEALQRLVREADPDLIVVSGDLTNRGELAELSRFREAQETVSTPVFPLFGGHDGNEERHEGGSADNTFTRNFEAVLGPSYYSFDWGGRHFAFYPNEQSFFSLADQERKEVWFWADLALQPADREIVVVVHTPPPVSFLEALSRYNVRLVLHGHWHSSKVFSYKEMVVAATPAFCFGGIDTSPRGYRVARFGEEGAEVELCAHKPTGVLPPSGDTSVEISFDEMGLHLRWEQQLPGGLHRAAPVQAGDQMLLSLRDEGYPARNGVCCIEVGSGDLVWHARTDATVKNSVAVDDGICVAVSVTGRVHALEQASGRLLWHANLPGYPDRWIYTSPVIAEGTLYAGAKAGYAAFDLKTGEQQWYVPVDDSDNWSCYASPQVYEDLLLLLVPRRGLMALDRQSGEVVWEQQIGVEYPYPTPIVSGDLLVSGGDSSHLTALRAISGEVVWDKPILPSSYPTGLLVRDGRIYATTSEGDALCFDFNSGALLWRFQTGGDLLDMVPYRRGVQSILAAPFHFEDCLLICGCDGCLYALDAASGECRGRAAFGSPITAPPCVWGDGLFLGTYDGRFFYFERVGD